MIRAFLFQFFVIFANGFNFFWVFNEENHKPFKDASDRDLVFLRVSLYVWAYIYLHI